MCIVRRNCNLSVLSRLVKVDDVKDGYFLVEGTWLKAGPSVKKLCVRRNRSILSQASMRFVYQDGELKEIIDLHLYANIGKGKEWARYLLDGCGCKIKGNLYLHGSGIIVTHLYVEKEIHASNVIENSFYFLNTYSQVKLQQYNKLENKMKYLN